MDEESEEVKNIKKGQKKGKTRQKSVPDDFPEKRGQKGVKKDEKNLKNRGGRKLSALKVNRIYGQTSLDSGDLFLGFSTSFFVFFDPFLTFFSFFPPSPPVFLTQPPPKK